VLVVSVTMVVSVLAALAGAHEVLGLGDPGDRRFPDLVRIPLVHPLFKIFATVHDVTGIELINHWWVLLFLYPTDGAVLHVDHDRLFRSIPKELDEAALIDGASYLQILTGAHSGGAVRHHRRDDLLLYGCWANFLYRSPSRHPRTSSCRSSS
jgi:multiple sugar transport system permease protein